MNKQEQIAYEKGIAEGRAEMTDENYDAGWKEGLEEGLQRSQTTEKQAYEKGVEKGLDMKWELCRKRTSTKAVADLKAKLLSNKVSIAIEKTGMCFYDNKGIKKLIEQALAEATKEGGRK